MGRADNVAVFNDTIVKINTNPELTEMVNISLERQTVIPEKTELDIPGKEIYRENATVTVSKKRTLEAAEGYKGKKVGVLNFASATNPGGGVTRGSSAQEEALCRCSTLYPCLAGAEIWQKFYLPHRREPNPLHNDDIIYTPDVVVLKTDTQSPMVMKREDWYKVDVITCAAPNLQTTPTNRFNPADGSEPVSVTKQELYNIHLKRFRRILDVAVMMGCEVVILGAFGCGAFRNDPAVVSRAAADAVEGYFHCFEAVEFAIYCADRETRNYTIFSSAMQRYRR